MFVDIHTHLLPGYDDGSIDLEETEYLLALGITQGLRKAVITPHYMARSNPEEAKQRILNLFQQLKEDIRHSNTLERFDVDNNLYLGAENFYHEDLADEIKKGLILSINNSRYYLIEFELNENYERILQAVRKICRVGVVPVIAHVERYTNITKVEQVRELKKNGAVIQVNYPSVMGGLFDRETRFAKALLRSRVVDVLASDVHRKDLRPYDLTNAEKIIKRIVGEDFFIVMSQLYPSMIIRDRDIYEY